MRVIFLDNVQGVALKGDVKNVKPGYFRNYLFPRKKALPTTDALLKEWEERKKKMLIEKEQLKTQLEELKRRLADAKLKIEKKVTKKGTLYGGVKPADIVKAMKDQFNLEIPVNAIILDQPIKAVGAYGVKLNFGEGVETNVSVEIAEKT